MFSFFQAQCDLLKKAYPLKGQASMGTPLRKTQAWRGYKCILDLSVAGVIWYKTYSDFVTEVHLTKGITCHLLNPNFYK